MHIYILLYFLGAIEFTDALPDLGSASPFAVLASITVTNTGSTIINGDIGVGETVITGFFPNGQGIVQGNSYTSVDQPLTDATTAWSSVRGMLGAIDLTGKDLGGMSLLPGVYKFSSSARLTGILTLGGTTNPDDGWYFQIGSTLTTAAGSNVVINDGSPCNVFWALGSSATLGAGTNMAGTILAGVSVTVDTATSLAGALIALDGSVTLDTASVGDVCDLHGQGPTGLASSSSLVLSSSSISLLDSTTSSSDTRTSITPTSNFLRHSITSRSNTIVSSSGSVSSTSSLVSTTGSSISKTLTSSSKSPISSVLASSISQSSTIKSTTSSSKQTSTTNSSSLNPTRTSTSVIATIGSTTGSTRSSFKVSTSTSSSTTRIYPSSTTSSSGTAKLSTSFSSPPTTHSRTTTSNAHSTTTEYVLTASTSTPLYPNLTSSYFSNSETTPTTPEILFTTSTFTESTSTSTLTIFLSLVSQTPSQADIHTQGGQLPEITSNTYPLTSPTTFSAIISSAQLTYSTSTIVLTTIYTITSCAPTITDCPLRFGRLTTEIISLTTNFCPVTGTVLSETTTANVANMGVQSQSESTGGSETIGEATDTSITWLVRTVYETKIVSTVTKTLPGGGSSGFPPVITSTPASALGIPGTAAANQTSIGGFQQVSAASRKADLLGGVIFWATVIGILVGLWFGLGFLV